MIIVVVVCKAAEKSADTGLKGRHTIAMAPIFYSDLVALGPNFHQPRDKAARHRKSPSHSVTFHKLCRCVRGHWRIRADDIFVIRAIFYHSQVVIVHYGVALGYIHLY